MNLKKIFYVFLTTALGLALSVVAHAFLEIWLINRLLAENVTPLGHWGLLSECYLPLSVKFGLMIFGAVTGFLLGLRWWDVVYVKKNYQKCSWC